MKRHLALHPLSREHHQALVLARRLERADTAEEREAARALWRRYWTGFLADHVRAEERWLGPLLERHGGAALASRLAHEHGELEAGGEGLELEDWPERCSQLGDRLRRHVRWEERELFPWLEARASEVELETLARGLDEDTRGASCALPES